MSVAYGGVREVVEAMMVIGLDPGVHTGFALWDCAVRQLVTVTSIGLPLAMHRIAQTPPALVIFEDARLRTWFGNRDVNQAKYGAGVREGVGSVKRDCQIWEEFLTLQNVPFIGRKPAARNTKWSAEYFQRMTGWTERTNEHGRDAACLVAGLTVPMVRALVGQWEAA